MTQQPPFSNLSEFGDPTGARVLEWRPSMDAAVESRYTGAFARARDWALEQHREIRQGRSEARSRARRLLGESAARQRLLVRNHPDFSGWRLAAVLVDEVEGWSTTDDPKRLAMAKLAVDLSMPAEGETAPWVLDGAARAHRVLAGLQIADGDLQAAGGSVATARRFLRRGTRDPLERAQLMEATGILLAARGRRRARHCLTAAARLYNRLSETVYEGRVRVYLALHVLGSGQGVAPESEGGMSTGVRVASASPGALSPVDERWALDELRFGLDLLDRGEAELHILGTSRLREVSRQVPKFATSVTGFVLGGMAPSSSGESGSWNEPA